jgi:hypothetical protein
MLKVWNSVFAWFVKTQYVHRDVKNTIHVLMNIPTGKVGSIDTACASMCLLRKQIQCYKVIS